MQVSSATSRISETESTRSWLSISNREAPLWLRTFYSALPVSAVIVLYGEVHDLHPLRIGMDLRPDSTVNALWLALEQAGFDGLLLFDPIGGLTLVGHTANCDESTVRSFLEAKVDKHVVSSLMRPTTRPVSLAGMVLVAEAVATSSSPALAIVIDHASQVVGRTQGQDSAVEDLAIACRALADAHAVWAGMPVRYPRPAGGILQRRPVIWLADKLGDLPSWMTSGDGVRSIAIPKPGIDSRMLAAGLLVGGLVSAEEVRPVARRLAEASEGLTTRGMFEAVQLARSAEGDASSIENAVRAYREGLTENPWQSPRLMEQLAIGEEVLTRRVLGQDEAVGRVLDILKRSALGLTGAHQKRASSAPRGILYFAGPTGVGKTEMAKAIAELVFADERALIRFDMSEFRDDHAKMRLVGAPPSYIGHGSGGELTNAVSANPHSIVLFDEMDKAGAAVYDLFLQILSDGRLTDGSGRTVSFEQTLVIFTSNQGVAAAGDVVRMNTDDPEQAAVYETTIREAVEAHFKDALRRPELLGRIGDNIVVFKPMRGETARSLASSFIDTVLNNVRINTGRDICIPDEVRNSLVDAATSSEHASMGGRGIALAIESLLTNPLARALFAMEGAGAATVISLERGAMGEPRVTLEAR